MPTINLNFSVDTHIFRELGELLVGRDSTALLELIKNCYDADATHVVVTAVALDDADRGRIVIRDDGCGMDEDRFVNGFLRIASRFKEEGRRSEHFKRRYTGSKGIGRLAAHKLAKFMEVSSICGTPGTQGRQMIRATIDWERIESKPTLNELTDEISLTPEAMTRPAPTGTAITLSRLRRPWSSRERTRFVAECRSFQIPAVLRDPLPARVFGPPLLFRTPVLRDATNDDPGCEVTLEGDFGEGDSYWDPLVALTSWVLEIDCKTDRRVVRYAIAPSKATAKEYPDAKRREFEHPHPNLQAGPFFQARALIRDSGIPDKEIREWSYKTSGVRVYLEGFRVLPYGDRGDDWLSLDANTSRRSWDRNALTESLVASQPDEAGDWQLLVLPNNSYTGGVFLTQEDAPTLRMLVNREGFVAEREYDTLVDIMKRGLDLATRTRAAATYEVRRRRREEKKKADTPEASTGPAPKFAELERAKTSLLDNLRDARRVLSHASSPEALEVAHKLEITQTAAVDVIRAADRNGESAAMLRVLSSLGTQTATFVHEVNGMLGAAVAVHEALGRLRQDRSIPSGLRTRLNQVYQHAGDLRRQIERQAAYMVEITSTDARRRRSKQPLAERFEAAMRLVAPAAERRSIRIVNDIPRSLKSPPMFPAELTVVFSNLLTNAVKAAGRDGEIVARGGSAGAGRSTVVLENTGVAVDLSEAERWFLPFESTTVEVDSTLGQGMGLGLTITRDILDQYGASVRFVEPSDGFATAVEVQFSDPKEGP